MIALVLVSIDLALIWFMCLTYLMAVDGKGSMITPTVLLMAIIIVTVAFVTYEVVTIHSRIKKVN